MKVYIDTEFFEYAPRRHGTHIVHGGNAVQLISIGAVREDGASFYAENADFDWSAVPPDHWLQENVRPHLWNQRTKNAGEPLWLVTDGARPSGGFYTAENLAWNFRRFAADEFAWPDDKPEFWGYFCDYDWVVLCGLYGRMIDLPPEFPQYCLDLKQEMHRLGLSRKELEKSMRSIEGPEHHALTDARWIYEAHHAVQNLLPPA